ncbi:MAG: DNA-processing protein DprA [Nocardioidaceae bacterium]
MRSVDDAERRARAILSGVCEPGDLDAAQLVRDHSATELVARLAGWSSGKLFASRFSSSSSSSSSKVSVWAERLASLDEIAHTRRIEAVRARYLCPGDEHWPQSLDDLRRLTDGSADRRSDAPFGLWTRGEGSDALLTGGAVAIVGSRSSTAYGDHVAGELAFGCGAKGFVPISGGAYGIDAAAHRGALAREGPTVAVLAGGVDRLYPTGNSALLSQVCRNGLVVSEAAPGCTPTKYRFLVRNRLIAALSAGTVVVEAAVRSGSLNTARWARDLGRGVMGVPGPVTSMRSAGVHELLRQPETLLVTDAQEVVEHISPVGRGLAPRRQEPATWRDGLTRSTQAVLDAVPVMAAAPAVSIARVAGEPHDVVVEALSLLTTLGAIIDDGHRWRLARPS